MGAGIYAFPLLEKEMEFTRKCNQSTEARLRVVMDQYDLIFASIDTQDLIAEFTAAHELLMKDIRDSYEYILDLNDENTNIDTEVDRARNGIEMKIGTLHRQMLLFARTKNILTPENVKEFFGRYRGSMNPGTGSGGDLDRRFA